MRIGLVGEVRASSATGIARSTVLRLGLVLVVVAGLHLVVIAQRSITAAAGREQLLTTLRLAVLVAAALLGFTAADREDPEEGGTDGECGSNPDNSEEFGVNRGTNTIELGGALDSASDNGGHGSGKSGGAANESSGDASKDPGAARHQCRAAGEDAQDDLNSQGDESRDKNNLCPLGDVTESLQGILDLTGELDIFANRRTDVLDIGGVERV